MKKYVWPVTSLALIGYLLVVLLNTRSEQRALLPEDHPVAALADQDVSPTPQGFIEFNSSRIGNVSAKAAPETLPAPGAAMGMGMSPPGLPGNSRANGLSLEQHAEIAQVLTELREVNDDPKKAELTKQLESAIVAIFDKDMSSRETDLSQLEERLTKLRAQLDRRRKAKSEIIQLQIKLMVNEADGLGFSGTPAINGRQ